MKFFKLHNDWKWIIGMIVALIIGYFIYNNFEARNILRWLAVLLSFSGVGILFYSFAGIFTKKKFLKWIVTILLVLTSIFIYVQTKKDKVVYMQEDVLYVHPKAHR